jgi:hypothetical protein
VFEGGFNSSDMHEYIERVVDLTDPNQTELLNLSPDEARQRMLTGSPETIHEPLTDGINTVCDDERRSLDLLG